MENQIFTWLSKYTAEMETLQFFVPKYSLAGGKAGSQEHREVGQHYTRACLCKHVSGELGDLVCLAFIILTSIKSGGSLQAHSRAANDNEKSCLSF